MPTWGVHLAIANKIIKQKNNISKNEFDNPIILGYYTHLVADYYFNKYFEEKKYIK